MSKIIYKCLIPAILFTLLHFSASAQVILGVDGGYIKPKDFVAGLTGGAMVGLVFSKNIDLNFRAGFYTKQPDGSAINLQMLPLSMGISIKSYLEVDIPGPNPTSKFGVFVRPAVSYVLLNSQLKNSQGAILDEQNFGGYGLGGDLGFFIDFDKRNSLVIAFQYIDANGKLLDDVSDNNLSDSDVEVNLSHYGLIVEMRFAFGDLY